MSRFMDWVTDEDCGAPGRILRMAVYMPLATAFFLFGGLVPCALAGAVIVWLAEVI